MNSTVNSRVRSQLASSTLVKEGELVADRRVDLGSGIDSRTDREVLVLLHGWAAGSWAWEPVIAQLSDTFDVYLLDLPGYGHNRAVHADSPEDFVELFKVFSSSLPPQFILAGWSLGGLLASYVAECMPDQVTALVTIATSPEFVASESWPCGLSSTVFESFANLLSSDQNKLLNRFALLQAKSSVQEKACSRFLMSASRDFSTRALSNGLNWLQRSSVLTTWKTLDKLELPVLHIYGESDQLVSKEVAQQVEKYYGNHRVVIFSGAGHLPFYDLPEQFVQSIRSFIRSVTNTAEPEGSVDRHAVVSAFSRAVSNYDRLATLQWRVANDLINSGSLQNCDHVVDLGSGTGFVSRIFPVEKTSAFFQLDICEQMLKKARAQSAENQSLAGYVQADLGLLPLANSSVDLMLSSMAIQWSLSPGVIFEEAHRALKGGGAFLFSTLLPGSLEEIQQAWSMVDEQQHVNAFLSSDDLQQAVNEAGFVLSLWQERSYTEAFQTARDLLASVKGIGAGNHRKDRSHGLLGKDKYHQFLNALHDVSKYPDRLSLSYRVLMVQLVKQEK